MRSTAVAGLWMILGLTACSSLPGNHNRTPPLPAIETIECCWQSEENVTLLFSQEKDSSGKFSQETNSRRDISLHAVIARESNQLTVLVLDSLGQRQLTLVHSQQTQVLNQPDNWHPDLNNYLLLAIFLHHNSSAVWMSNNLEYSVRLQPGKKSLLHRGSLVASITYDSVTYNHDTHNDDTCNKGTDQNVTCDSPSRAAFATPELAQPRSVHFAGLPLTLHITTLSRQPL